MTHVNLVSRQRPGKAQFEPALQLVGLLSAVLGLFSQFASLFGVNLSNKGQGAA